MNTELLKTRVKSSVKFHHFMDNKLYYVCADGFSFPIPVADTKSDQGDAAVFHAEEKGIYMMRWIRKAMEEESE